MFTGIIEDLGTVEEIAEEEGGRRLRIGTRLSLDSLGDGASIAVDGACLTVTAATANPDGGEAARRTAPERNTDVEVSPRPSARFDVEVIGTTLSRTVAGEYREGSRVNLERARALGERLDGHLVQGHVDGRGRVTGVREDGIHHLLEVALPPEVWRATILHGSITLNGVSLTVNGLEAPDRCEVALIPYTWNHTNLSGLAQGDPVNVEGDLIGKYVGKYLRSIQLSTSFETDAPTQGSPRGDSL